MPPQWLPLAAVTPPLHTAKVPAGEDTVELGIPLCGWPCQGADAHMLQLCPGLPITAVLGGVPGPLLSPRARHPPVKRKNPSWSALWGGGAGEGPRGLGETEKKKHPGFLQGPDPGAVSGDRATCVLCTPRAPFKVL